MLLEGCADVAAGPRILHQEIHVVELFVRSEMIAYMPARDVLDFLFPNSVGGGHRLAYEILLKLSEHLPCKNCLIRKVG